MADKLDSNPASFHYAVTSRRPSAYAEASAGQARATRKGGARSEPERRRYAGAGQPIYSRRRAIGWFSSQSVRSTRFRRISFFEPESYTFLLKIVQHYLHWATRKGGTPAASPSVGVYYAGAGQPRPPVLVRGCPDFFFEPESYTFLLKIVQHYLHWATRKGGARSEPERRRYAGAGQPIYSRRRAIGWFSSQSVRSTRFRRISFFEPESYTFRAKKIRQSGIALRNPGKKMGW